MIKGKAIGSAQLYVRLTPGQQEKGREKKKSRETTNIASYQKWTINTKMMKVGEGKSGSVDGRE